MKPDLQLDGAISEKWAADLEFWNEATVIFQMQHLCVVKWNPSAASISAQVQPQNLSDKSDGQLPAQDTCTYSAEPYVQKDLADNRL